MLNEASYMDRVTEGLEREQEVLDLLNDLDVTFDGYTYHRWEKSSKSDDMKEQIDARLMRSTNAHTEKDITAQIKVRYTGIDIGVAIVRPYDTVDKLKNQLDYGRVPWDRDFTSNAMLYVSRSDGALVVCYNALIKGIVNKLLRAFVAAGKEFDDTNSFQHPTLRGAELKLVTDKGKGHTEGQKKIICYISVYLMKQLGAYVKIV